MPGAGMAPAGLSPAGTGTPPTAPAIPTDNLVDQFGAQQEARLITSQYGVGGQYVLNADGRVRGMPRVQQLVLIRIRTMLSSSAVKNLGLMPLGGDNNGTALRRIETACRNALNDLVLKGLITIVGVTGYSDTPTRTRTALKWRDLTSSTPKQEIVVPL